MIPRLPPFRLLNGRVAARGDRGSSAQQRDESPEQTSAALRKSIQMLYVEHVSESGVDYGTLRGSEQFAEYVAQTAKLPRLQLDNVLTSDCAKMAFFVNLYNSLMQHAVVVCGPPPGNALGRLLYASLVGYRVGGFKLSLNQIEHGILRGNRRVGMFSKPFGARDARLGLAVQQVDARVHFVLNCAASSCPPVLFLTANNCQGVLERATSGFLSNQQNFRVVDRVVFLSMIFKWYRFDFVRDGSELGILRYVVANSDAQNANTVKLKRLLEESAADARISWLPYDWSLNGSM